MELKRWPDWVTLVVGLALIAFPWVIGYGAPEGMATAAVSWTLVLSGLVAVVLAGGALFYFRRWEEWLDLVLAAWLIISPWIIGFAALTGALYMVIGSGLVIGAMALWGMVLPPEHAHP